MRLAHAFHVSLALALLLSGCKEDAKEPERLTVEQLKNPETCMSCHPIHYREWKASMHAYASDDPVFLAMNELGQQETNGELGDFCVKCHAPLAVKDGLTDGSHESLEELPDHYKGVTCYFCHNVESVDGDNNGNVTLANDTVMRGGLIDPLKPSAHGVSFSSYLDRKSAKSAQFCGGCHDIENAHGVHLERTFAEYKDSIFAHEGTLAFASCVGCHMPSREGLAAVDETQPVGERFVHSHLWPGVDVALTEWPDRQAYFDAVQCALDGAIRVYSIGEGDEPNELRYTIETNAGHKMPSGASQDRRMWIEMVAFDAEDKIMCSLGLVPDDEAVATAREPGIACGASSQEVALDEAGRPVFRDRIFDEDGNETHMFWRAAPSEQFSTGFVSNALPPATMAGADGLPVQHVVNIDYTLPQGTKRVTLKVKMRPMDFDVLDELVDAGTLDPAIMDEIPTFTIAAASAEALIDENGIPVGELTPERSTDCNETFFCAFDPDAPMCAD